MRNGVRKLQKHYVWGVLGLAIFITVGVDVATFSVFHEWLSVVILLKCFVIAVIIESVICLFLYLFEKE